MHVLIAEDEPDLRRLLSTYFSSKGHSVQEAENGAAALDSFKDTIPDLILLDIRMPKMDGWEVLDEIRKTHSVPVLVLTALDSPENAVKALQGGADDYLRKPFDLSELDARIDAVMRRGRSMDDAGEPQQDALHIDQRDKSVHIDGHILRLSPKPFRLLSLLASDPGRVFSSAEILNHIWPGNNRADTNDVKQCIHLLRKQLREATTDDLVHTVAGFGYRLSYENSE